MTGGTLQLMPPIVCCGDPQHPSVALNYLHDGHLPPDPDTQYTLASLLFEFAEGAA